MPRLFVSYARVDLPIVASLVGELRDLGYEPFFDQDLTGGQRWWDILLDRIAESDGFLPVLSENYCESEACRLEANWAHQLNIPVVPIDLGEIGPELCDPAIAEANWVRYSLDDRASVVRLARAVNALPPSERPTPLPERPPIPVTYLAATRQELRDPSPLGIERQLVIIANLRGKLATADDASARALLADLRRRADVTYANAVEIDALLKAPRSAQQRRTSTRVPAEPPSRTAGRSQSRPPRSRRTVAIVSTVVLVALIAAIGVWLGVRGSGSPAAQGPPTSGLPAGGHPSMSMSMSMSTPVSKSALPPSGSLAAVIAQANVLTHGELHGCRPMVGDDSHVVCAHPYVGVSNASFETYASTAELYDAYQARITKLNGGVLRTSYSDCSAPKDKFDGEISWNHLKQHLPQFTIQQSRSGKLNPLTEAAGRVFCTFGNDGELTMVWTQNAGYMLGEVSGTHDVTYGWWFHVHHQISGITMKPGMHMH